MQTIHLEEIRIQNRQRRKFDEQKIAELAESIKHKGLLHPPVLQNDCRTLVAGERRIRALALLYDLGIHVKFDGHEVPANHVPYVKLEQLSRDDLIEAELEENILRENLTWQEEATAIATLHSLRTKQKPGQTIGDTAVELAGDYVSSNTRARVSDSILLNEHIEDEEVAKAKTPKEAMKVIRKKAEAQLTAKLAEEFNVSKTPHTFFQGDFRSTVENIKTSSVDIILTDPPYGVGANNFGSQAGAEHEYEDSQEYFEEILRDFVVEATRVAKLQAHAYVFCDIRKFSFIAGLFEKHGWDVWETPLIWNKSIGMLPKPDFGPRRTYEAILFANRGAKKVKAVYSDLISESGIQAPKFGAEKPAALYINLLRRSASPGDCVWDPFAGAGPIFPAANSLDVRVIASEMIPDKYNHALLRIEQNPETDLSEFL